MKKKFLAIILSLITAPLLMAQTTVKDYVGPGNFFISAEVGSSISIADFTEGEDIVSTPPTLGGTLGYHFTPYFGMRLQALMVSQRGHASEQAVALNSELYKPYNFYALVGSLDGMLNIVNLCRTFDSRNIFDCYAIAGFGQLYTFGFDDRLNEWNPEVFFVDPNRYRHWQWKVGVECAWHLNRMFDFKTEFDWFFTNSAYNGNKWHATSDVAHFPSLRVGFTYYFRNARQRHRFGNQKVLHPYWKELN